MIDREAIKKEYLDYVNNYVSYETWGEHRGLSEVEAARLINAYRDIFNAAHPDE
jgi:hypothetical protein